MYRVNFMYMLKTQFYSSSIVECNLMSKHPLTMAIFSLECLQFMLLCLAVDWLGCVLSKQIA